VLLVGVLTVLVLIGAGIRVLWPGPSAVTRENEARIHEGMGTEELQEILGGPPRDDSTGPTELDPDALIDRIGEPAPLSVTPIYEWRSDQVLIRVHFDAAGRVDWISACPLRRAYPGVLETARHRFHR
jgi:hypothetical protein